MCMSFCTLVMESMAPPREPFGARLNETVIAGNCPWWVIESGSVVRSKCENALNGTALLVAELVAPADPPPRLIVAALEVSGLDGAANVFAEGVYRAEVVSELEPAEVDPRPDADEPPAPLVPAAALD